MKNCFLASLLLVFKIWFSKPVEDWQKTATFRKPAKDWQKKHFFPKVYKLSAIYSFLPTAFYGTELRFWVRYYERNV